MISMMIYYIFGLGEEWNKFQYNACRNLAIK